MATKEIRVYTSSKLKHAGMLASLRDTTDGFYFTARWIVSALLPSEASRPAAQWQQDNFDDIGRSNAVLVYVEFGEHLKGGLVEVGVALAYGLPVFVVGQHTDYSKWQYHPLVHRCQDIPAALKDIRSLLGEKDKRAEVSNKTEVMK